MVPHLLAALSSNAPIFIEKISNIHWPEGKKNKANVLKTRLLSEVKIPELSSVSSTVFPVLFSEEAKESGVELI